MVTILLSYVPIQEESSILQSINDIYYHLEINIIKRREME